MAGSPPFLSSLVRDSCVPSLVQGLLWVFAIFVRISDPSGYTKLLDLRKTHTQLRQKAPWGEQIHQCTHRCSTWKSTLAIILLHCLILPHLASNFYLALWHGIVFYPLIWPAAPSIFFRSLTVLEKEIRICIFNISCCLSLYTDGTSYYVIAPLNINFLLLRSGKVINWEEWHKEFK